MRFASQQIAQQNSESLPESRAKRKFPVSEYKYYNPANRTKNVLLRKTVHFFVQEKNCSRNIQGGGPFCYILPSFAKCSHRKTKHREKFIPPPTKILHARFSQHFLDNLMEKNMQTSRQPFPLLATQIRTLFFVDLCKKNRKCTLFFTEICVY